MKKMSKDLKIKLVENWINCLEKHVEFECNMFVSFVWPLLLSMAGLIWGLSNTITITYIKIIVIIFSLIFVIFFGYYALKYYYLLQTLRSSIYGMYIIKQQVLLNIGTNNDLDEKMKRFCTMYKTLHRYNKKKLEEFINY